MKNREKFAKEIFDIACSGSSIAMIKGENKLIPCSELKCCDNCEFDCDGGCTDKIKEWCEAEYEEPRITIPADTPIDTKILVSDDGKIWLRRHFAGFDEDLVSAWLEGNTSWSNKNGASRWKYGKLAEESDGT